MGVNQLTQYWKELNSLKDISNRAKLILALCAAAVKLAVIGWCALLLVCWLFCATTPESAYFEILKSEHGAPAPCSNFIIHRV